MAKGLSIFSIMSFLAVNGCGEKLPPVTTCLFDQPRSTFHCNTPEGFAFELMPIDPKSDKLVCLPFTDLGVVLSYCNNLHSK